jgi:primase-polymerase (primpol)-like protein
MAVTGKCICANEPQPKQEEIDRLYQWLVAKRDKSKTSTVNSSSNRYIPPRQHTSPTTSILNIDEIIARATSAKGGREFQALYNGDWQSLHIGDGTQSASDLSFCNRLAFWTGADRELMIEIFRTSGMYRGERKMLLAVDTALKSCGAVYQPTNRKR